MKRLVLDIGSSPYIDDTGIFIKAIAIYFTLRKESFTRFQSVLLLHT
jgi:hypothetical protein